MDSVELPPLPVTGAVEDILLGPLGVGKSDSPAEAELPEGWPAGYVTAGAEDGSVSGEPYGVGKKGLDTVAAEEDGDSGAMLGAPPPDAEGGDGSYAVYQKQDFSSVRMLLITHNR